MTSRAMTKDTAQKEVFHGNGVAQFDVDDVCVAVTLGVLRVAQAPRAFWKTQTEYDKEGEEVRTRSKARMVR
jgi:hypothetical protein